MSRIHEALKKAAEERSARLPAGMDADLTPPVVIAPEREANFQTAAQSLFEPAEPVVLPYDEMIKKCVQTTFRIDPRMSVFAEQEPGCLGAERFRTLRSRLYQIASAQTLRKLVITSTVPAEGKTLVAANLAQSIVQQPERRVLLIDADLRASRLHLSFGAQRSPGLADYLSGEANAYSVIQKGQDTNLCLIAGGKEVSNPSELLLNERLEKLLEMVTPMFDWVILDAPPALPVHDASIIADKCDGVLFVVRAGDTDSEVAAKVLEDFKQKNLVGVVLNRVERGDGYGGYYYSYPSEESKRKRS